MKKEEVKHFVNVETSITHYFFPGLASIKSDANDIIYPPSFVRAPLRVWLQLDPPKWISSLTHLWHAMFSSKSVLHGKMAIYHTMSHKLLRLSAQIK